MTSGAIRFGGIAVFVSIGVGILGLILAYSGIPAAGVLFYVIAYALGLFSFWCVRAYLTAAGYSGANAIITSIVILSLVSFVIGILAFALNYEMMMGAMRGRPMAARGPGGGAMVLQIINFLIAIAIFVLAIIYAVKLNQFSRTPNGTGIWRAIGTMIIVIAIGVGVVFLVLLLGGLAGSRAVAAIGGVLALLLILLVLATYIVQGVALIQGAGRLERGAAQPDF